MLSLSIKRSLMKYLHHLFCTVCFALINTGCTSTMTAIYEDAQIGARYITDKGRELFGMDSESKLIESEESFLAEANEEYIPLQEADLQSAMNEFFSLVQPKDLADVPDTKKNHIAYSNFRPPSPLQKKIFKNIHFSTDSFTPKDTREDKTLDQIAKYLKRNKNTYLFIEGHCDQRGDGKYNLALGTRRANNIRSLLVKRGVHPRFIYTVSYGKDKPLNKANTPAAWSQNRRVSFKLLHKS